MKIADSPYGAIHYTNGELENRAHVGDPVAYRGGAKEGGSLVKFSGDRIRPDNVLEECVLLQFKEDERHQGSKAGEATLHLRRPHADGDAAMVHDDTFRHDGIQFHVPTNVSSAAPSSSPLTGGMVQNLVDSSGRYFLRVQEDGNLVLYDRISGADVAYWSTGPRTR
jgi:hypothetical protein